MITVCTLVHAQLGDAHAENELLKYIMYGQCHV